MQGAGQAPLHSETNMQPEVPGVPGQHEGLPSTSLPTQTCRGQHFKQVQPGAYSCCTQLEHSSAFRVPADTAWLSMLDSSQAVADNCAVL